MAMIYATGPMPIHMTAMAPVKTAADIEGKRNHDDLLLVATVLHAATQLGSLQLIAKGVKEGEGNEGDVRQGARYDGDEGDTEVKGHEGDEGLNGDEGSEGGEGSEGARGDEGDEGNEGVRGDEGIEGARGDEGGEGNEEVRGDEGDEGVKGDEGDEGNEEVKGGKGDVDASGVYDAKVAWPSPASAQSSEIQVATLCGVPLLTSQGSASTPRSSASVQIDSICGVPLFRSPAGSCASGPLPVGDILGIPVFGAGYKAARVEGQVDYEGGPTVFDARIEEAIAEHFPHL